MPEQKLTETEADDLTVANYIGTDECSECGKLDEVLDISDEMSACRDCINKAFESYWGGARNQPK